MHTSALGPASLPAELRPRGVPDPVRVRECARVLEQQPVALLRVDRDVREERRERLPAPARAREEQRREARAGLRGQRRRGEVREQRARRVGERVLRGEVVALCVHVQRLGEERVAKAWLLERTASSVNATLSSNVSPTAFFHCAMNSLSGVGLS